VRALLDTNILVDYLNGVDEARLELGRFDTRLISMVTWMEVLVGARAAAEETTLRAFLAGFSLVEIDRSVAEEAIRLRRLHRMRLPDALIWASARTSDAVLVTRNTRDFPADDPGVRVPYRLGGG
jgi:predicted nucleic acid-binding protein